MAITSFPFDNQDTTETEFSRLFRELQDSGVADSLGGLAFAVSGDSSGMNVKVQPGFAILRGFAVSSTAVEVLTIQPSATSARTDRVVLRLDPALNSIVLDVKAGTPGSSAPALTQTDTGVYELSLATVLVGANVATISPANVTDTRAYTGARVRVWTTSTRPTAPRMATFGYNSTTRAWEYWTGSGWAAMTLTSIAWGSVTGKPSTFPASSHSHAWGDITGKPSTFAPSSHSHTATSVPSSRSNVQSDINWLSDTKSNTNHGHPQPYEVTVHWSDGSGRPRGATPAGSATWYSVWVDGFNNFCRNTSARKYKENIRDFDIDPADVLALQPVIYDRKPTWNEQAEEWQEGPKDEVGLIADDVDVHLPWLIEREDGEVEGLRYDLLGVALLEVVKNQQRQISRMQAQIAHLS